MTDSEAALWKKIESFNIDVNASSFTFTARLARENGWEIDYAKRVVLEYQKFIFLSTLSQSGIAPSDAVKQVWHLHMTRTKSYWVDFCRNTLGKDIHPNSIQGRTG